MKKPGFLKKPGFKAYPMMGGTAIIITCKPPINNFNLLSVENHNQNSINNPTERTTVLHLFTQLTLEERQSLFDDLIKLASVGHSDIELVRTVILSFDKVWLLNNIEKSAESLLNNGTDEEYRPLLELYINIDYDVTKRLVKQALETDDPDIYEVGEDFHNYLKNR